MIKINNARKENFSRFLYGVLFNGGRKDDCSHRGVRGWRDCVSVCLCAKRNKSEQQLFLSLYVIIIRERNILNDDRKFFFPSITSWNNFHLRNT